MRVKIAELKSHLSEHLRNVERGDEVIVTDRERPIARIVPFETPGTVVLRAAVVPFAQVRRRKWKPARWALGSSELLDEERRER
ncbi:MAG: type II toxin-antitoxin system prevent-host-death family antitoxin [Myxococcota bacterium]|nr:type II toxin-antitoxin system prevent-host-death family antitoxin [Myxococcota bacterium]